jgi:hypothetical protein
LNFELVKEAIKGKDLTVYEAYEFLDERDF